MANTLTNLNLSKDFDPEREVIDIVDSDSTFVSYTETKLLSRSVTGSFFFKDAPGNSPRKRLKRTNLFALLPDEILLRIFAELERFPHLVTCFGVCHRWKKIGKDPSLWTCLSFKGFENISDSAFHMLLREKNTFGGLKVLDLSKCHSLTQNAVKMIPRTTASQSLVTVNLSWCSGATDASMVEFSRCPNLENVYLSFCRDVTSKSVTMLALRCPKLRVLDLNCCQRIKNSLLVHLGKYCSRITSLNIANSKAISDEGVSFLVEHCKQIESLDLSWCTKISDVSLYKISSELSNLRELGLSESNVTNAGIITLAESCSRMENLKLAKCNFIDDIALKALYENCHKLKDLNIASCHHISDQSVLELIRRCRELQILDASRLPCRDLMNALTHASSRKIKVYF